MKNKLAIIGMGGHSNVIEEIARSNEFSEILLREERIFFLIVSI